MGVGYILGVGLITGGGGTQWGSQEGYGDPMGTPGGGWLAGHLGRPDLCNPTNAGPPAVRLDK